MTVCGARRPDAPGHPVAPCVRCGADDELAKPFALSQPAISRHLKVLEQAGLISRGRDAQRRPRRLVAQPLAQASAWLERYRPFWEESFERLDELLKTMKAAEKKNRVRNAKKGKRK